MEINGKKVTAQELVDMAKNYNDGNFRRGYIHGYYRATEASEHKNQEEMVAFVNDVLREWQRTNVNQIVMPPDIK